MAAWAMPAVARAHKHLGPGEFARYHVRERGFNVRTDLRRGEYEAVVAVDRALYAAGPGEGLLGPQKYRADGEQAARHALFNVVHALAPPMNSETQRRHAATGSSAPVMGRPTTI